MVFIFNSAVGKQVTGDDFGDNRLHPVVVPAIRSINWSMTISS